MARVKTNKKKKFCKDCKDCKCRSQLDCDFFCDCRFDDDSHTQDLIEDDDDDDEHIYEEDEEQVVEKATPYETWEKWWQLCCDHSASPQNYQAWNGAIDTVLEYVMNELCGDVGLERLEQMIDKTKRKFKTK
jgi:hypothetical protein